MQFRLDHFYRINRRALIWAAILGLLYILKDFFALIFVTFLLVSFTLPVVNYLQRETRIPRTVIIVGMYLLILAGLIWVVRYAVPRITAEATSSASELAQIQGKVLKVKEDLVKSHPSWQPLLDSYMDEDQIRHYVDQAGLQIKPKLVDSAKTAVAAVITFFLALLFSFLIVLDLSRLTSELRRLERSRLHDIYEESAEPVVRFFSVIAKAFQIRAIIALADTVLTLVGFLILGLPKIALLTIVVLLFSFIPVLGVFISTTPAVLVAFNFAGYGKAAGVIALICLIHILEAYVFNPLLYGRHLNLNPVLILIILYVGHHFFGVWGMLLGVPVAYYFLYYVFRVPMGDADSGVSSIVAGSNSRRNTKTVHKPKTDAH